MATRTDRDTVTAPTTDDGRLLRRMGYRDPDLTRRLLRHDPAAADAAITRALLLAGDDVRRRTWEPSSPSSPCIRRMGRYRTWDGQRIDGWHDHPCRLIDRMGRVVFVSEPYCLSTTGLANLRLLGDEGWHILIRAEWALHYPGETMAIWLRREPWGLG